MKICKTLNRTEPNRENQKLNRTEPNRNIYDVPKSAERRKNWNIFIIHYRKKSVLASLYPGEEPLWFHIGLLNLE